MSVSDQRYARVRDALLRERAAHRQNVQEAVRLLTQLALDSEAGAAAAVHVRLATAATGLVAAEVLRELHHAVDLTGQPVPGCPWCGPLPARAERPHQPAPSVPPQRQRHAPRLLQASAARAKDVRHPPDDALRRDGTHLSTRAPATLGGEPA